MKENLRKLVVVTLILSIVVTSFVVPKRDIVKAQSSPNYYSLSMSIKDGEASMVINGNHAYQLTEKKTVSDGGFSSECTLFLLFKNGMVFWYNFEHQGEDNVELHYLDTNVKGFTRDGEDHINGYVSNNGKQKDIITEDEIKELLAVGDTEPVLSIPASLPTETMTPSITARPTVVPMTTVTPTAVPTITTEPTIIPTATANVTEPIEIPEVPLNPIQKVERKITVEKNKNVTFEYEEEQYKLSTGKIVDKAGLDNRGTVWIRYADGSIYFWNHAFQKDESKINLIKLTSSSNCLLTDADGVVTAWYNTKAKKQKLPTNEQIFEKVKENSYKIKTTKTYKKLYIDNKKIDELTLQSCTVTYNNLVIKNVKYATFNLNGNVVIITKTGKLIVINRFTMKKETVKAGIKNFQYTTKKVARYAIKNNGNKINLNNY